MDKNQSLIELENLNCEIAEVICDVLGQDNVVHKNQSILVFLVENPSCDDLIDFNTHYYIFDSVEQYKNSKIESLIEIVNVKEVKDFAANLTRFEVETQYKSGCVRKGAIIARSEEEMWKQYDRHHNKDLIESSMITDSYCF